jgi:ribosomal protein L29
MVSRSFMIHGAFDAGFRFGIKDALAFRPGSFTNMPVLTVAELRKMHTEDLLREIRDLRRTIAKASLDLRIGKSKGSHSYRAKKRELAMALTVLAEKGGQWGDRLPTWKPKSNLVHPIKKP